MMAEQMEVYSCTFEIRVTQANISIKFPCSYLVQIKSLNNKTTFATTKSKVQAVNNIATFNEHLMFETDLLFNSRSRAFVKKEVHVSLMLISTRKPDQQKLVGRVTVDLAAIASDNLLQMPKMQKLDYCSVNAFLGFGTKILTKRISTTPPQLVDRDSFGEMDSFVTGVQAKSKPVDYNKKIKSYEVYDKNSIIEESQNEDLESRTQHTQISHNLPANKSPFPQKYSKPMISDYSYTSLHKNMAPQITSEVSSPPDQREADRNRSEMTFKPSAQGGGLGTKPAAQYEELLRNSHAQQKKIWEEEKKLLQEKLTRQKQETIRIKERCSAAEKKAYETDMKLSNYDGKLENSKREMLILEKEKNLQIQDLKSQIDWLTREKMEKIQVVESKEAEVQELKDRLRDNENQRKRAVEEHHKDHAIMLEKTQATLKLLMSSQQMADQLRNQIEQKNKEQRRLKEQLSTQKQKLIKQIKIKQQQQAQLKKWHQSQQSQLQAKLTEQQLLLKNAQVSHSQKMNELESRLQSAQQREAEVGLQYQPMVREVEELRGKFAEMENKVGVLEAQNQGLKGTVHDTKEYQAGLEQSILCMYTQMEQTSKDLKQKHTKISELQEKLSKVEELLEQSNKYIDKLTTESKSQQQYIRTLELDILNSEESAKKKKKMIQSLETEVKEKDEQNQELRRSRKEGLEYQQGLEEQILSINDKIIALQKENIHLHRGIKTNSTHDIKSEPSALHKKITELESTIQCLREYQNNLEERILEDHVEMEKNRQNSDEKIRNQDSLIKHLKDYQHSLEEKILLNHEEMGKEGEFKKNLVEMEKKLLHHKQYQNTLEQRILKDHEQITKQSSFKTSIKNRSQQIQQPKQYQSALILQDHEESNRQVMLQNSIRDLQEKLRQQREYQHALEEKILEDHEVIDKLETGTRDNFMGLHDQCKRERERLQAIIQAVGAQSDLPIYEELVRLEKELQAKNAHIVSLEKMLESTNQQTVSPQKLKRMDILGKKDEIKEESGDEKSMEAVIRIMEVHSEGSLEEEEKDSLKQDKQDKYLICKKSEILSQPPSLKQEIMQNSLEYEQMQITPPQQYMGNSLQIPMSQPHRTISPTLRVTYPPKQVTEISKNLINSQQQIQQLKATIDELSMRLKLAEKSKEDDAELSKLKSVVEEYEGKIRMMKNKEIKIQEALKVIEEESNLMVEVLTSKEKQCIDLQALLQDQNHQIELLQTKLSQESPQLPTASPITHTHCSKNTQYLEQQLQSQAAQIQKYEQLLSEMAQRQDKLRQQQQQEAVEAQREIHAKLVETQAKLREIQGQLVINKRLVAVMRDNRGGITNANVQAMEKLVAETVTLKKRVEELEEELFSYQSSQNQKQIQILALTNQLNNLKQNMQQAPIPDISHQEQQLIQTQYTHQHQLQEKSQQVVRLEQQVAMLGDEVVQLESLMKQERLDFFATRRHLTEERDLLKTREAELLAILDGSEIRQRELSSRLEALLPEMDGLRIKLAQSKKQMISKEEVEKSQQLQAQLKYYSEQVNISNQRITQLQLAHNQTLEKLFLAQHQVEQISCELQLCQQQNLYLQQKKSPSHSEPTQKLSQLSLQNSQLRNQLNQVVSQHTATVEKNALYEKEISGRIQGLERELHDMRRQKDKAVEELEEREMHYMNTELDLQFKLKEKNDKSQLCIATLTDLKKSRSQDVNVYDLVPVSKVLKDLVTTRTHRGLTEKQIQVMAMRITQLEEHIASTESAAKEKGLILEKTRMLSMQFSKFKVSIMKSKMSSEERIRLLTCLRPLENMIKEILKLSEIHSENLLTSELPLQENIVQ